MKYYLNFNNLVFMKFSIFFLIFITIFSCATTDPLNEPTRPKLHAWESFTSCYDGMPYHLKKNDRQLFTCSVKYTAGMKKHYPEWQVGREYMAITTRDRKVSLEPIYDTIYHTQTAFIYRKNEGDFFTKYNLLTNKEETTPIDHLEPGKHPYESPIRDNIKKDRWKYSGAFSDNMTNYYIIDEELNIVKKITNVDNDQNRKSVFPPVHSLYETFKITTSEETKMVRHNINGRVFYQVYDAQGSKIGDEIPYDKVVYFYLNTNPNGKYSAYDARPWVSKGSDIYMPIVHGGKDTFFDGTKDWGDFLGQYLLPDNNNNYVGIFAGYQYPKGTKAHMHRPGPMIFKDEKGLYQTKINYYFHYGVASPLPTIEKLKKDPKNFTRSSTILPFFTGEVNSEGKLAKYAITVYEELDGTYSIADGDFKARNFEEKYPVNSFTSFEEAEKASINLQQSLISIAKARAQKAQEEKKYQDDLKAARERTDVIMAGSRAARDQRQNDHAAKMAIQDHNKKFEKPNPLLNLDLHKLMDTEGAKRKAACFKKMSDSKKKYLSGSQRWYYQGDCK